MMPKKDGYQVCEELKRNDRSAHIPIIFLSAKSQVEDKIRGLDLGGADYVTKPFDRGEVLARVRTQLNIAWLTKEIMNANKELLRKQKRLDEDLEAAAGIQQSLLPQESPDMKNVAVAWRFMPCESIGGDIFNVVQLDETHLAIYMLDVSGHGVPSALVTVSVSQMLQTHRGLLLKKSIKPPPYYEIRSPAEVLNLLDQEYPIERFNKYFTISYLILDLKEGLIRYSNAAHPSPILLHMDGTLELLAEGGTIIGMGACFLSKRA
jgi:sigma-B regulation protein RsbU (phosphoserine phosphatase)